MFKKILVADDLHQRALKVLQVALEIARNHQAEMVILNVREDFLDKDEMVMLRVDVSDFQEKMKETALAVRDKICHDLAALGGTDVKCEVLLREGEPAEQIIQVARELQVDLVVVGSHGRQGLKQKFFGSISGDVIQNAQRCVLSVWVGE